VLTVFDWARGDRAVPQRDPPGIRPTGPSGRVLDRARHADLGPVRERVVRRDPHRGWP
jgi:hypothetical protein